MADVVQVDLSTGPAKVGVPTATYASAVISAVTETIFAEFGAVGGPAHYSLDGLAGQIVSLGGAANVVIRLYADVNGADQIVATVTLTATGFFTLESLKPTATGGANALSNGYTSRHLKLTYAFAATPTNASLAASAEAMKRVV